MSDYKAYTLRSIETIEHLKNFDETTINEMKIVANVLPFKTNNYVINELINWKNIPDDPIFRLTFPHKDMLIPHHYERMREILEDTDDPKRIKEVADSIRWELNPHPAGQKNYNVPSLERNELEGMQHKYRETVLFFPQHGQTCHAYCSFCFRWPQFVNLGDQKFAMKEVEKLIDYLNVHPEVTDVLFTGGDPMVMSANLLERYFMPLVEAKIPTLKTIRIGSKSLSYWPSKYVSDQDSDHILSIFNEITDNDLNLSFMAHFNHFQELQTDTLKQAVKNIRRTGAQIRTQSPILNHINADPDVWIRMWREQVDLGMIPYYMFQVRDTGAQHYFNITLETAWKIFTEAYSKVSGICRTVRGPSMSCTPGKIAITGISNINNQKYFNLRFIQGRNPDWVNKPFFAKYNPNAIWINDLEPAFEDKFFYEDELENYLRPYGEIELEMIDDFESTPSIEE